MTSLLQALYANTRGLAHYLDQPQIINGAHRFVRGSGLYAVVGAKLLYDTFTAKPGEEGKTILRDGLVLLPTMITTAKGIDILSKPANSLPFLPKSFSRLYPSLRAIFRKVERFSNVDDHGLPTGKFTFVRGKYSFDDIKKIISVIINKDGWRRGRKQLEKLFPAPAFQPLSTYKFMLKFFGIGGLIVLSGLTGGLLYDYITSNPDKKSSANKISLSQGAGYFIAPGAQNKIREALFQFIANIALCAVGASLANALADRLRAYKKVPQFLKGRAANFAILMSGLSLGILGGGYIANWFGQKFVEPLFSTDKKRQSYGSQQNKLVSQPQADSKRKIELLDLILHLDDLPTALALAGVQIFVPLIPLFFLISGYRTGIGYRNNNNDRLQEFKDSKIADIKKNISPPKNNVHYCSHYSRGNNPFYSTAYSGVPFYPLNVTTRPQRLFVPQMPERRASSWTI